MYNLKVKTNKYPTLPFQGQVNGESNLFDLRLALYSITSIPVQNQKILIGFPPKQIIGSDEDKLKFLGIKDGDVVIVEEVGSGDRHGFGSDDSPRSDFPRGSLIKKVVPSDNSCLFTSIYFLVNGGDVNENNLQSMREIVAESVAQEPQIYNEALLEKSNADYCRWILKDTSWGGAIELSVFSDYYQIEIVALNVKAGLMNRFGEDKKYEQRIFLMYDGIHYDPLYLETFNGRYLYIFPSTEEWLLDQAYALVQEAKISGHYTDTNKFCLVCNECGIKMYGEQEAMKHAKQKGHSNFAEVKQNV